MMISCSYCYRRLSIPWLTGAFIIFILLLYQTFFGHYGEHPEDAWKWLLPNIVPTLSLVVGTVVTDAQKQSQAEIQVDSFAYHLALALSIFYMVVLGLTILMPPFSAVYVDKPLELMKLSNFWLAPLQGLTTTALGVFFVRKENKPT